MTKTLAGLGVLVTRPQHQAEPLCRLIDAAGGRSLRFPGIAILPARDTADAVHLFAAEWDLLVFVSRNAVDYGFQLFTEGRLPASVAVAAVGRATASALSAAGREADLVPEHRYDSEGLLELPELRRMNGKRVLIVRGNGGFSLLGDTLRDRGAQVEYAEVYSRAPPQVEIDPWIERLRNEVHLVTATSAEIVQNLYRAFGPHGRPLLVDRPLVVISARIAVAAEELGFKCIRTTERADDQAILKVLIELAARLS